MAPFAQGGEERAGLGVGEEDMSVRAQQDVGSGSASAMTRIAETFCIAGEGTSIEVPTK